MAEGESSRVGALGATTAPYNITNGIHAVIMKYSTLHLYSSNLYCICTVLYYSNAI